jgi:glycerophosphoryl diester phosphodiesterase
VGTRVIGHRGASHDHPENTLEAFAGARELGADWVELDVRVTADGHLVVHHDPALADGRVIASLARADLPPSVPTLAEALAVCSPMGVNVEIKNDTTEPDFDEARSMVGPVLEVIEASGVEALISSFDFEVLEAVHRLGDVGTGYLVYLADDPIDAVTRAADAGHDALHPWYGFVDRALVDRCHDIGLEINVWTADEPEWIAKLADWGVDGIVTNRPDVALRTLGR